MKKSILFIALVGILISCERVDAGHEGILANLYGSEKEANELKAKALTPAVLKQMWIEKWDGKLPTVTAGNQMIMDISKFK